MHCGKCGTDNRADRRFCSECGAPLELLCGSCGFANKPGEKFCGGCGGKLDQAPGAGATASVAGGATRQQTASVAERRQLTVLFCDIVGSTALATKLDPEDLREVVRAYENHCAAIVTRFGGFVAQFLGDGVLAFFGYPQAHEDDAERAVRAAIEIASTVQGLESHSNLQLHTRVGVATGLVVVGEVIASSESLQYAVSGETPNLAARLQSLAMPDTVIISEATRRLLGRRFEFLDLGVQYVKGIDEPMRTWQVCGINAVDSRFDAAHTATLTHFVGREPELALLLDRWEQVKNGEGQVVLLCGEAGIGKSRMTTALHESIQEPFHRLTYQCLPYYANSALYPVIRQIELAARLRAEDSVEQKLGNLKAMLGEAETQADDALPLLTELLGIPAPARADAASLSPARRKEQTFGVLMAQLSGLCAKKPVLLVFEDAHWSDPTTIELLDLLISRLEALSAMIVITYRPDFTPAWSRFSHVTTLAPNRLSRRHCMALITNIAGGVSLPEAVQDQILAKTDGIPLFVEEQTKMVLESGLLRREGDRYVLAAPLPELAIPSSLQDSLMARLDRLAEGKELAQVCAAIGRDISHALLEAVAPWKGAELHAAIGRLIASGMLTLQGAAANPVYSFKHALIQDVAYNSMLKANARTLHRAVAAALEERFPERARNEPEVVAFHYSEAGMPMQAVEYWQRAGKLAMQRCANAEAIVHYRHALTALESLPEAEANRRCEADIQIAIGVAMIAAKGYTAPEVLAAYTRACALAEETGDRSTLFSALWGLWTYHRATLEMQTARRLADQLGELAGELGDPSRVLAAHHAQWTTLTYLGDLLAAHRHAHAGCGIYVPESHHDHVFIYGGHDPGVCGHATAALDLCLLGNINAALEEITGARRLAEPLAHGPTLAHAFVYSALLHQFLREPALVLEFSERTLNIGQRLALPGYIAATTMLRAWSRNAQGQGAGSISEIREYLDTNLFMVAGVTRGYFLSLLAEVQADNGDIDGALATVDGAIDDIGRHRMRFWEPELHRLRGELLLKSAPTNLATSQECFQRALDIAREQHARLLELRAAVSLARCRRSQEECRQARALLTQALVPFSDEPLTFDVQEARQLLAFIG